LNTEFAVPYYVVANL